MSPPLFLQILTNLLIGHLPIRGCLKPMLFRNNSYADRFNRTHRPNNDMIITISRLQMGASVFSRNRSPVLPLASRSLQTRVLCFRDFPVTPRGINRFDTALHRKRPLPFAVCNIQRARAFLTSKYRASTAERYRWEIHNTAHFAQREPFTYYDTCAPGIEHRIRFGGMPMRLFDVKNGPGKSEITRRGLTAISDDGERRGLSPLLARCVGKSAYFIIWSISPDACALDELTWICAYRSDSPYAKCALFLMLDSYTRTMGRVLDVVWYDFSVGWSITIGTYPY